MDENRELLESISKKATLELRKRGYNVALSALNVEAILEWYTFMVRDTLEGQEEVYLDYIGKFVIKNERLEVLNLKRELRDKGHTEQEINTIVKEKSKIRTTIKKIHDIKMVASKKRNINLDIKLL